jgi:hypothetical protein
VVGKIEIQSRNIFDEKDPRENGGLYRLSYPFVGFDLVQDDFRKVGDENQIGRTGDLHFGTVVTGELGYSNSAFGANHDAVMVKRARRDLCRSYST